MIDKMSSLHSEPASTPGLPTVWSLWGNPGMVRCRKMSTLLAGYIPQCKVTSASNSGSLGFIVCVNCCRMVHSGKASLGEVMTVEKQKQKQRPMFNKFHLLSPPGLIKRAIAHTVTLCL